MQCIFVAASNSNIKLKNIVSGLPLDQCNKVYRVQNVPLGPKQLCAGGVQGFDSCRSDSGGPLMGLNVTDRRQPFWYLAGIISLRPSPCGQAGWPGVSTRVDSYIGWILEHLRIWTLCARRTSMLHTSYYLFQSIECDVQNENWIQV